MNDRRTSHYGSDNDEDDISIVNSTGDEASGDVTNTPSSQHRTPRGGVGNYNENSFGSSVDSNANNAYQSDDPIINEDDGDDTGNSGGKHEQHEHAKWSPNMKIDGNFDIHSPVVASVTDGANAVAARQLKQQQLQLSPRSQSQSSTTTLLNSSTRLTKYLCIASAFLVVCSLGLATAGLGLIYSTNRNNNTNDIMTSQATPTRDQASFDSVDKEVATTSTATPVTEIDMKDDDETNAKPRLTVEPTMTPTVVFKPTEAVPAKDEPAVISAIESIVNNATLVTTTSAPAVTESNATDSDKGQDKNDLDSNHTTTTSAANTTAEETSVVLLVPETLLSTTLHAIADTFLEQNGTQAYGRVKRLKVDAVPARASLLKFNISAITVENNIRPKDVVGYSLRLYSLASSPYGGKIDVLKRNCNSWNEPNITWDNAPRCVFHNNSNLVGEFEKEIPEFEWNEAMLYMNEDIFEAQVITLRITSHYADGVMYASRENHTAIPELVVYYTPPTSPTNVIFDPTQSPIIGEGSTTLAPSSSPDQDDVVNSTSSSGSPSMTSAPSISPMPSLFPTQWPTYFPTSSPTSNGTVSPTLFPTTTPDDIFLPVIQDAMIRGGEYSNSRYGLDPFVALTGLERKALLEFDLSPASARPKVEYEYTLQIYVSYVAENEQRSVTASCIAPEIEYNWDEFDITWNTYGTPPVNEIGWFTIFLDDMDTLVSIPLGSLSNCTSSSSTNRNKFILVMEVDASEGKGDKFDFRSREYGDAFPGMKETPPVLIGVPTTPQV